VGPVARGDWGINGKEKPFGEEAQKRGMGKEELGKSREKEGGLK